MAPYPAERTIIVSRHAAGQLADRTRSQVPVRQLLDQIEAWVRCGVEAGNVLDHKPKAFRLYRERAKALPKGQRFIWCGDEPRFGFIVDRKTDGTDIVKTTIVRVGVTT